MSARLAWRRRLARAALWMEVLWPALWPALGVAGAFVCLALLGVPALLPAAGRLVLLGATALAIGGLLWRGLRAGAAQERTGRAAADRQLERASGLRHRPLATLTDRPAGAPGDPLTRALWAAHQTQATGAVGQIRVGWPHPGLAARDRHGLRGGLAVALVACLAIAGADAPRRLAQALAPGFEGAAAPGTEIAAWITPPGYTGLAPRLLPPGRGTVAVPTGSRLLVNVSGGAGRPVLRLDRRRVPFRALDAIPGRSASSFQAEQTLAAGGRLRLTRGGRTLADWTLRLVPDRPPTAAWAAPPGPLPEDALQTRLPWRVTDDYGVVALTAELRLRDRPGAAPLRLAIPLPEATRSAAGSDVRNLTANPWAGLAVVARLVARDGAGQIGRSGPAAFVLPQRPFHSPLARALIAIRRGLSLHPEDRAGALAALGRLPLAQVGSPAGRGLDGGALALLGAIGGALAGRPGAGTVPRVQAWLWRLALHVENGTLDRTARALERARRAARAALARETRAPSAAHRQELAERLRALEQAIQARLRALARQADRGATLPPGMAARGLSAQAMQRLAAAAQRAAARGDMGAAARRLARLEQMLDALRSLHTLSAAEQRAAAAWQRAQQQLAALQQMIRREGRLVDHAYQRQQREAAPAVPRGDASATSGAQRATQRAMQRAADAQEQAALRQALAGLEQRLGALAGHAPPSLDQAGRAMDAAGAALAAAADPRAEAAERQAILALQQGSRQMSQALAQHFGAGGQGRGAGMGGAFGLSLPGGGQPGDGVHPGTGPGGIDADGTGRDPLGRRFGTGGSAGAATEGVRLPGAPRPRRIEQILRELRRRAAEQNRPREEREYLDRLLKRF